MAGAMMDSRGPSRGGGGGGGNNEEDYEEYMKRISKRGEGQSKGLAWIVLAHAPTTDAYINICYSRFHPLAFISD